MRLAGRPGAVLRPAHKTLVRTRAYLAAALLARPPARDQVLVAWGLLAAALWTGLALRDAGAGALLPLLLTGPLAAICAIDSRWGLIPDPLNGLVFALGVAQAGLAGGLADLGPALAGAAGVSAAGWALGRLHLAWRGYAGFGGGDVKLVAAAVPWLGVGGLPAMMMVAVGSALVGVAFMRLDGPVARRDAIAFGPHLCLGLAWTMALAR